MKSKSGSAAVVVLCSLTLKCDAGDLKAAREDSAFQGIQPARNNGGKQLDKADVEESEYNLHGADSVCLESPGSDICLLIPAHRTSVAECPAC